MNLESKPAADASLGELMSQLSSQTSRLFRDEMRLAQKEFQESAKHAGIGAGLLSVAGLLAVFGFAAIVTAGIAALSLAVPVWASALIVAAVLLLAAGVAGLVSKGQVQQASPAPEQTVANVKKDIDEVKEARHGRA
jgi:Flp pilus assembly protein TadB